MAVTASGEVAGYPGMRWLARGFPLCLETRTEVRAARHSRLASRSRWACVRAWSDCDQTPLAHPIGALPITRSNAVCDTSVSIGGDLGARELGLVRCSRTKDGDVWTVGTRCAGPQVTSPSF